MSPDPLSTTFAALADPTRCAILARLASSAASVMELAEPFKMSLPAISKYRAQELRGGFCHGDLPVSATRGSPSFQRTLESRGGAVDSGSRPTALPGMTKKRTRCVFSALCTKHLKVLENAGLIARGREAQWRPCRIEAGPLKDAAEWLEHYRRFWEQSFDRLDEYLRQWQRKEKKHGPKQRKK